MYANTLYEPKDAFFQDRQWAHITDWRAELAPHYDQAKRMLGVMRNPTMTPSEEVMKQVAEDLEPRSPVVPPSASAALRPPIAGNR